MKEIAQFGSLIIYSLSIVFHLLVLIKIIPYKMVWGGRLKSDIDMYKFEAVSLTVNLLFLFILFPVFLFAQKKSAFVSGKVVDENENPLANVSIVILGQSKGITTNDSGYFKITVTADKAFALVFTYTGRKAEQKNFMTSTNCNFILKTTTNRSLEND